MATNSTGCVAESCKAEIEMYVKGALTVIYLFLLYICSLWVTHCVSVFSQEVCLCTGIAVFVCVSESKGKILKERKSEGQQE